MKQFAILTIATIAVSLSMSSCMREKFNHGLPRNNYQRPKTPKTFAKTTQPQAEKAYVVNTAK